MKRNSPERTICAVIAITLAASTLAYSQTEVLTNASIIELSAAGLGTGLIITKMSSTAGHYDISANALIELKKSGVDDEVIALMIEKSKAAPAGTKSDPTTAAKEKPFIRVTPKEALRSAKTISFQKDSIAPSRQALEKELLRRADWKHLDLTIVRYREQADLYVEIGFVHGSLLTHRYVFRIYDRRSGAVLAAGETTSWGSLAANLARHISKRLNVIATS